MRTANKVIMSQIFFLITISLIANKAFFSHIHILPDGKIIVHAHPYSKRKQSNNNTSNRPNHSHTNFSFNIIDQSSRFDNIYNDFKGYDFKPDLPLFYVIILTNLPISNPLSIEFVDSRGPPFQIA